MPNKQKKKIAMIVTSKETLGGPDGPPSGFWFEELATPYWEFHEAGFDITIASTEGKAHADPWGLTEEYLSENVKKFLDDQDAMQLLNSGLKVSDLNHEDLDAVFFVGGFATTYDYPKSKACIELVEKMASANKVTAAICSGVCSLFEPKLPNGKPLLDGKEATAPMNTEVGFVGLLDKVALKPETRLKEVGGNYQSSNEPFQSYAVADGNVITGQQFASSKETAQLVIKALG